MSSPKDGVAANTHPLNLAADGVSVPAVERIPLYEVYMRMAEELAKRSTCSRLQVGTVVTDQRLENVLAILAWNGGAHANPTFAGDTLYAWSEVLDKADLPGRTDVGALRLRLVGVKNLDLKAEPFPLRVEKDGKSTYHPNVVLDLD